MVLYILFGNLEDKRRRKKKKQLAMSKFFGTSK
jgi:hypothetical protein